MICHEMLPDVVKLGVAAEGQLGQLTEVVGEVLQAMNCDVLMQNERPGQQLKAALLALLAGLGEGEVLTVKVPVGEEVPNWRLQAEDQMVFSMLEVEGAHAEVVHLF